MSPRLQRALLIGSPAAMTLPAVGPAEAAILETFVVPRFLTLFGDAARSMLLAGEAAYVAHLGCRTGYPDRDLLSALPNCAIVGIDSSAAAAELARNKAATLPAADIQYLVAEGYPTSLEGNVFSHALSVYPLGPSALRKALFLEMTRLLYSGGQAIVSLPMRGSFQELIDLLNEYCLKYDDAELSARLEVITTDRPTEETLTEELEDCGLAEVEIATATTHVTFDGGRAFVEDPTTRLLIIPDLLAVSRLDNLSGGLDYVRETVDKYWSESQFALTVNIAVASARKP
ncbi:MAG TPA: class I SAM-dependent methyltransferase [Polyangiaceae bacterium]|nr:class I SAM-dependent methyltransferase [Polyangiaceae bacterium]